MQNLKITRYVNVSYIFFLKIDLKTVDFILLALINS